MLMGSSSGEPTQGSIHEADVARMDEVYAQKSGPVIGGQLAMHAKPPSPSSSPSSSLPSSQSVGWQVNEGVVAVNAHSPVQSPDVFMDR